MAKGANAKIVVANKLAEAFGADYIGEVDKKYYVWADDGGEKVQIAIAMTCPKVNVECGNAPTPVENANEDWDFSGDGTPGTPSTFTPAEVTEEEQQKISDLMAKLGL